MHGFVHRMGTHLSQCQPSEMEEIASDFVCVTHEKLQMSCGDKAYVINMDQTPVSFHMIQKNHRSGWTKDNSYQEVNIRYEHATCALTVTAFGKMIAPLFVFKGKN